MPLPALSGRQLIALLESDGWEAVRRANHGVWLRKWDDESGQYRFTNVPTKPRSIAPNLLGQILSSKQTGLGSAGLQRLLDRKRRRRHGDGDNPPDDGDAGTNLGIALV